MLVLKTKNYFLGEDFYVLLEAEKAIVIKQ